MVLSMKDSNGSGHIVYFYKKSTIYLYVINHFAGEEGDPKIEKTSWGSFGEIRDEFYFNEFNQYPLKWAALRGVPVEF